MIFSFFIIIIILVLLFSADTSEDIPSGTNQDLLKQHQPLERTTSIETFDIKSEPINNEEYQKCRAVQSALTVQSSIPSISTKSFLISPPTNVRHQKKKPPISTTTNLNVHASGMIKNSNNIFAPRIPSTMPQKTNWPTAMPMTSSTRHRPNMAHKRPSGPPIYPLTTAQRNSNSTAMRMVPSTTLQPQSFDVFSMSTSTQRRPNGIIHSGLNSNTPSISTRNPVRVR